MAVLSEGGATLVDEDRALVGRFIRRMNLAPIDVGFEVGIHAANGVARSAFGIRKSLPPGGSVTIPWKELGPMRGPLRSSGATTTPYLLHTPIVVAPRTTAQRFGSVATST